MKFTRYLLILLACLLLAACAPSRSETLLQQPEATQRTRRLNQQPLRQSFALPPGTSLSEIELVLAMPDSAPASTSRPLYWEIKDGMQGSVLREGVIETSGYIHNTPLRLRFEPLTGYTSIELSLTAPPDSELSLWTSSGDRYYQGTLLDSGVNALADLHFTLRTVETPLTLPATIVSAADRWRRVVLWIPLLLLAPGLLLLWLARPADSHPSIPLTIGISLALAPIIYLWSSVIGLRLYEPLVQSFFQSSGLAILLLVIRHPPRFRALLERRWRGDLAIVTLFTVAALLTWLLATRPFLAPPGDASLDSALMGQELVRTGLLDDLDAPIPLAALTATLTQLGRYPIPFMLLLGGLLLGVTLAPSLYALAVEVGREPNRAVWLLPLAWLWPTPWHTFVNGELTDLFSIALLPVTVALGLRAMRTRERPWRTLLLAAVPLAALMLVQGVGVAGAWFITMIWTREGGQFPDHDQVLFRSFAWPLAAILLLLPAWFRGNPVEPLTLAGYDLLLFTLLAAELIRWFADSLSGRARPITLLVLIALPFLLWWRSAPMESNKILVTQHEIETMEWAREGTRHDALFLVNMRINEQGVAPADGGLWMPLYGSRATIFQREFPVDLLLGFMQDSALTSPEQWEELRNAGVSHLFIGEGPGLLKAETLMGKEWARLTYQSGSAYIFELVYPGQLPPPPEGDQPGSEEEIR